MRGRRQPENGFEGFIEMALVGKTGGERDFAERRFGRRNLPVGKLDAQTAHVFADGAAEFPAKNACQVNRMNADNAGDVFDKKRTGKIRVQKFAGLFEPARNILFSRTGAAARGFRENFQNQTFDGERGKIVRSLKFLIKPASEIIYIFGLKTARFLQHRRVLANRRQPPEIELDAQNLHVCFKIYRVRFFGRMKNDG